MLLFKGRDYRVRDPSLAGAWIDGLMLALLASTGFAMLMVPVAVVGLVLGVIAHALNDGADPLGGVFWTCLKVGAAVVGPLALGASAHSQIRSGATPLD